MLKSNRKRQLKNYGVFKEPEIESKIWQTTKRKQNKKNNNTYNMAESSFLARNKEIFTHVPIREYQISLLVLCLSLCSRFQNLVQ